MVRQRTHKMTYEKKNVDSNMSDGLYLFVFCWTLQIANGESQTILLRDSPIASTHCHSHTHIQTNVLQIHWQKREIIAQNSTRSSSAHLFQMTEHIEWQSNIIRLV